MKGTIPSYGKQLIKIFQEYFKNVFTMKEFRTSIVCKKCKAAIRCTNTVNGKKNEKTRKVHKILCCQNIKCGILWNRDVNASGNQLEITERIINKQEEIKVFTREIDLQDERNHPQTTVP